jgi:hypothetical protein
MRKQQIENAAYEVATQIRTVEESIDSALAEIAELQTKMVHARSVTGVGYVTSHAPFEQLAAAINGLVQARGGIAGCHAALADTKKKVPGLRTVAIGDHECPEEPMARADLRIVA